MKGTSVKKSARKKQFETTVEELNSIRQVRGLSTISELLVQFGMPAHITRSRAEGDSKRIRDASCMSTGKILDGFRYPTYVVDGVLAFRGKGSRKRVVEAEVRVGA